MKKHFFLLIFGLLFGIGQVWSYAFEVDGICYNKEWTGSNYSAVVTYREYNNGNYNSYSGDVTIPPSVTYEGVTYQVTSIGSNAFNGCSGLTSITIPSGVTSIGWSAFNGCSGLTCITIPSGVTNIEGSVFYGCSGLTSITIPSGVTSIGNSTFYGCFGLTSITIPSTVTSIGNYAFSDCSGLTSITIPSMVTSIGEGAFFGTFTLVSFSSTSVPSFGENSFSAGNVLLVPANAVEEYRSAANLSSVAARIIPNNPALNNRTAYVTAKENGYGIHEMIPEDEEQYVVNLKLSGTINGYDLLVLSKKMPCLRTLDLSEAHIVSNPFNYYGSYHSEDNVLGAYAFYEKKTLVSVELPADITEIGGYAFQNCQGLQHVGIPSTVKSIGYSSFNQCYSLREIELPDNLVSIGAMAFAQTKLQNVTLPDKVKTIAGQAFAFCNLTEIRFPASLKSIDNNAFDNNNGIKKVYTSVLEPIALKESSFSTTAFQNATLYIPHTSHQLYYEDMGWSRFLHLEEYDPSIENCYIDNDYVLEDEEDGRLHGEGDNDPSMEMNEGSGLIVEGEENQPFDELDINHNGTDGASLITDGNVTADHLHFHITVRGGRWYFFCFPFDIKLANIVAPGRSVWRHYNGSDRATYGQGGWKDVLTSVIKAGKGYIFQCDKNGTLELTIEPEAYGRFVKENKNLTLETYASSNAQNASWNFVGNPFLSYYQIEDMKKNNNISNAFSTPITVWDGSKYVAYRPGDDDYQLKPFEAFFVQKSESDNSVTFDGNGKMTHIQGQHRAAQARARRAASVVNPDRLLVDITLAGSEESEPDRTRIVFNEKADAAYEVGTDASKFMTAGVPQLWTTDAKQTFYAINERPAGDGDVELGFRAPATGNYTLRASRFDTDVTLIDNYTGVAVKLTDEGYTFLSEGGTFADRFILRIGDATKVKNALVTEEKAEYYNVAGQRIENADANGVVIKHTDGQSTKSLNR